MTSNDSPVASAITSSSHQQSMRNRKRKAPVKRPSTIQFQPSTLPVTKHVSANDDELSKNSDDAPKQPVRKRLRKIIAESDDEDNNHASKASVENTEDISQSVVDDERKKKRKRVKAKLRSELPLSSQRRQLSNAERFARFLGM